MRCNMWIDSDQGGWIMNIDINISFFLWHHKLQLWAAFEKVAGVIKVPVVQYFRYKWVFIIPSPSLLTRHEVADEITFPRAILFHEWISSSFALISRKPREKIYIFMNQSFVIPPGVSPSLNAVEKIIFGKERNEWDNWIVFLKLHSKRWFRKFNHWTRLGIGWALGGLAKIFLGFLIGIAFRVQLSVFKLVGVSLKIC